MPAGSKLSQLSPRAVRMLLAALARQPMQGHVLVNRSSEWQAESLSHVFTLGSVD